MERVDENIRVAGRLLKPHGVKGEIIVQVDNDALFDADYVIVPVDGLFVPFFVENHRGKSDSTDIIKFEDIDSDNAAQRLCGQPVYLKIDQMEDLSDFSSLEGYVIYDKNLKVGVITAVDNQTENVLFEVKGTEGDVLIPAVDEWIEDIDDVKRVIKMSLPEGLTHIN